MMTCEVSNGWDANGDYIKCEHEATHYVMDRGAGGWGGRACAEHAEKFPTKEILVHV